MSGTPVRPEPKRHAPPRSGDRNGGFPRRPAATHTTSSQSGRPPEERRRSPHIGGTRNPREAKDRALTLSLGPATGSAVHSGLRPPPPAERRRGWWSKSRVH